MITATGAERFDLMGASLGAPVGATWAARQPATVSRLVLYGGWAYGPEDGRTPVLRRGGHGVHRGGYPVRGT